jgi:magnesium transporter
MNPILAPELLELINSGDRAALLEALGEIHPAELAEFAAALDDADVWRLLGAFTHQQAADIFSHFDLDRQVALATGANRKAMARLLEDMPADDRVDLVRRLDPQVTEQILPLVAKAEREDIRKLASFSEGTAGSLMNSEYATLRPDMTVAQALDQIRIQAPTKETIYYIYVCDEQHHLLGLVSLKNLILARPSQVVRDIMFEEVSTVAVDDDQEIVARKIERYDLLAIPVIDAEHKLVGIITQDDVLDVIRQEQQEDIEKFMGISGSHQTGEYLRTPAWMHFRKRATWIICLAALGLVSGKIIHSFEGSLTTLIILALYMPMIADTGGNTGSQAASVVIRGLAVGEIQPNNALRVLAKEFQVSCMLALVLATLAFLKVLLLSWGTELPPGFTLGKIGVAIALALGTQVISATLIGALLPMGVARLKFDPAVVASPALTTIVDITGLLIYFGTARFLLGV